MTLPLAHLRRLLDDNGLRPTKALGQHFVADPNTLRRIARLAGVGAGSHVVEVGAGLGSLTLALAETGAQVTAVEVDRHLVPVLSSVVADCPGVRVVHADGLALDWDALLEGAPTWDLVANLPYNVATPLVVRVLERAPAVRSLLVMVQREVGERYCAHKREKAYGAVTVKIAYWATARLVGTVPRTVFYPRPNVDSVLVRMERRTASGESREGDARYDRLCTLVEAGFSKRRKMLRRSLAGVVTEEVLEAAGIAPSARAEELGPEEWGALEERWSEVLAS